MHITTTSENESYEVALSGIFTFSDHAAFREILAEISQEKTRRIVMDMTEVTFIDSAGLGQLLLAHDEAVKHQKPLIIKGAAGQVRKMFEIAHFDNVFTLQE